MVGQVRLTYSVELNVKCNDMDELCEFLASYTPKDAYALAISQGGEPRESYDEELISELGDSADVDVAIDGT